jgi:hypothetical protein
MAVVAVMFSLCQSKKERRTELEADMSSEQAHVFDEQHIDGVAIETYLERPEMNPAVRKYVRGELQPQAGSANTHALLKAMAEAPEDLFPLYFTTFMHMAKSAGPALSEEMGPYAIELLTANTASTLERLRDGAPDYFTGLIANELYKNENWQDVFDNMNETLWQNTGENTALADELQGLMQGIHNDIEHLQEHH